MSASSFSSALFPTVLRVKIAVEFAFIAASTRCARDAATRADTIPILADAANSRTIEPIAIRSRFQGGNDFLTLSSTDPHHTALVMGQRVE
jgi:hypothetical protein